MAQRIRIFDTTLRDGEQTPGVSLNADEKVLIARQLEKLGVDAIEAGFAIASKGDFDAISMVSQSVKNMTVASLARAMPKDIDTAYQAICKAQSPRIHTFLATSDIHMQYKLKMTRDQVIERIQEMVAYAKKYLGDIEFSAEDASRSDVGFLILAIETAIKAGATVINIPDTVGYTTPVEFGKLIHTLKEKVTGIEKVEMSVHCHNDLGLGVANTLAALENGATQLECTINGLGERAGNAALEEIIMAMLTRKDYYGEYLHNIDTRQLTRTSSLVSSLTGVAVQPNKAVVGKNAFAHESGIHQHGVMSEKSTYEIMTPESVGLMANDLILGKHSGRHAFEEKVRELGYSLSKEEIDKTFASFKDLADKKKQVLVQDIEALIVNKAHTDGSLFELDSFQINSGNRLISTAAVIIKKNNVMITEAATGDGPVDAALNAVERCIGFSMVLEDYKIRAVTGGKDALGEVNIRVNSNGRSYSGHGISTDIIEASILAYVNAANRVCHAEGKNGC
ncbi:MAG: 2-isopropylmalate synthase [Clostridia bacterium]